MSEHEKKYHRKVIAEEQLKTAIILFLNNKDSSSVITLASAAGTILSQLVRNSGQEPFIDYACNVHNGLMGFTPKRESYNHYIDKEFGVTVHKHMSDKCSETVELDLHECAVNSLTRAVADYTTLYGQEEDFIKAFLQWAWINNDGHKIMEQFKNMPEKLKKK